MRYKDLPRRSPRHPLHRVLVSSGVTVTDAAMALGCSRAWLSGVIHGHRTPGPDLAARMGELELALREDAGGVGHEHA